MNLTQQVINKLGFSIVNGTYGPHNPVPSEAILCQEFNVSRSAAREAVKSLAAKGLLSSRARQGIRVKPAQEWNLFDLDVLRWIRDANPSLRLLKEFNELRVAIEPEAAMLAAQRQNPEKIAQIAAALERMKNAELGLDDALESDIAFHMSLFNASENRFLQQLGRIIDTTLRVSIRFTNEYTGVDSASYEDHKKIYDSIATGNAKSAFENAKDLINATLETIDSACED